MFKHPVNDITSEKLVKDLTDPIPTVRASAAWNLRQMKIKKEEVVDILVKALLDSEASVRSTAAETLGELGYTTETVIKNLVNTLLFDLELWTRRQAAEALGKLGKADTAVIEASLKILSDNNEPEVLRGMAADLLGKFGSSNEAVIVALLKALVGHYKRDDDTVSVRKSIVQALGELGNPHPTIIMSLILTLNDKFTLVRLEAVKALGKLRNSDDEVILALMKTLFDVNLSIRRNAVEVLGKLGNGNDAVIMALINVLSDTDISLRQEAIKAIGILGNASGVAIKALVEALSDKFFSVQLEAIESLVKLNNADNIVIVALVNLLSDPHQFVRRSVVEALRKLGNANTLVIQALSKALSDNDYSVRNNAMVALTELWSVDEETVKILLKPLMTGSALNLQDSLLKTLPHQEISVRKNVIKVSRKSGILDGTLLNKLIELLSDVDKFVRFVAIEAIGEFGIASYHVIHGLIKRLSDSDKFVQYIAKETLKKLKADSVAMIILLNEVSEKSLDVFVRNNAAKVLGILGNTDEAVLHTLIEIGSNNEEPEMLQVTILDTLRQLENVDGIVLMTLIRSLSDKDNFTRKNAAVILGKLGNGDEIVITSLIEALSDEEQFVRYVAIEALGRLGNTNKEVIRALVKALSDSDEFVQYIAAVTLRKFGDSSEDVITALAKTSANNVDFVRQAAGEALKSLSQSSAKNINEVSNDQLIKENQSTNINKVTKKRKVEENHSAVSKKRTFSPQFDASDLTDEQLLEIKIQTDQPPPHQKSPDYSKAALPKDVSDQPSQGVEQRGSTNKFNSEDRVKVGNQGETLLFNFLKAHYQEIFRASLTKDTKNSFALERKFKLSIVKPTSLLEFHQQYQLWLANVAAAKGDTLLIFDPDKKIWQGFLRTIKKNKCEIIEANNAELNSININMEADLNRVKIKIVDKEIFGKHTPRDYHLDVIWHNANVESYKSKDLTCIKTYANGQVKKRIFEVKTAASNQPTEVKFSDKQLALMRKHGDNYWFYRIRGAEGGIDRVTMDKYKNPYKRIMGTLDDEQNIETVTAISEIKIYI